MSQAIEVYNNVTVSDAFREAERTRDMAKNRGATMNTKSKSRSTAQSVAATDKPKVRKPKTKFHGAVYSVYGYFFAKYIKRKDIEIFTEYELSGGPRRIDLIVIKKKRDVEIDTVIGRIYRADNIVEVKSPADNALTLQDFDKAVHVYAGGYAYKNKIMLTDMTVSIVVYKKPVELFEVLEKNFNYKIKRGDRGIYYIELKGVPIEKTLRIQIVVCPELSDEYWELDALARELRPEELPKLIDLKESQDGSELYGSDWGDTVIEKNKETLKTEEEMIPKKTRREIATAWGFVEESKVQKKWQEGMTQGMTQGIEKVLALLNVDPNKAAEVKRQLQLQPA